VSLAAFVTKWSLPPTVTFGLVLALGLLMLAILSRRKGLPRPAVLEVGALLLMIPLVSPLGWDYQFVTSVLAITLLARHWFDLPVVGRYLLGANLAVIGLSIYDLIGASAYGAFMAWSVLTPCFLLVLGYLAYIRLCRVE
jgi:hypothetical protein